ncbi:hypothetical protein [Pelagibius sp.]|uniref:hypothetical protein n=1 Tax=Pelagibius sp. TaxID=1931238 RepID=UPI003B5044CD
MSEEAGTGDGHPDEAMALLRTDALPTRDGGGIVFPFGPLSRGFYLDEWSFIRYSTASSEADHAEKMKPLRAKIVDALPELAAVVIVILLLTRIADATDLGFSALYGGLVALYAVIALRRLHRTFRTTAQRLLPGYPSARPVPYFRYWKPRVCLHVTAPSNDWKWMSFNRSFLPLLMAWQASQKTGAEAVPDPIVYALAMFGLGELVFLLAVLVTYRTVHNSLGRAPTADDLEPV